MDRRNNFFLLLLLVHGHGRDSGGRPVRREELEWVVVEGDAVGEVSLQRLHQVQDDAVVRHHRVQHHAATARLAAGEREREEVCPVANLIRVMYFLFRNSILN